MSKSIMSNEKICYVCHTTENIHRHHIFYGMSNRKNSEEQGCWCYLCAMHHNMSSVGVHYNQALNLRLKRECQQRWEELNGTREQFRQIFGKSYL